MTRDTRYLKDVTDQDWKRGKGILANVCVGKRKGCPARPLFYSHRLTLTPLEHRRLFTARARGYCGTMSYSQYSGKRGRHIRMFRCLLETPGAPQLEELVFGLISRLTTCYKHKEIQCQNLVAPGSRQNGGI